MQIARDRERQALDVDIIRREREPMHAACTDYPSPLLSVAIEIRDQRAMAGKAFPVAFVRDGDGGDDYEPLRREFSRGIPAREFGGRDRILSAA